MSRVDPQIALVLSQRIELDANTLCNAEERAVAAVLRWGRQNALQIPQLAALSHVPPRLAQEIIQHLLFDHKWPIGTSMGEPYGNYLIESGDELERTVDLLRRRGLSNLARAAALQRMTLEQYVKLMQGTLDLENWRS